MGLGNNKHARFQTSGVKLYSELTASFALILPLQRDATILLVASDLNQPCVVEYPNEDGSVAEQVLPARCSLAWDFTTNGMLIAKGNLRVKYYSTPPTEGMISVTAVLL